MKSLLKRAIRPLVLKIEARVSRLIESTVRPLVVAEIERTIRPTLDATRAEVRGSCERTEDVVAYLRRAAQENTLLLDGLTRELVRVQMQLESLEPVAPLEDEESGAERLMIG
jgi:hypothetical protein